MEINLHTEGNLFSLLCKFSSTLTQAQFNQHMLLTSLGVIPQYKDDFVRPINELVVSAEQQTT